MAYINETGYPSVTQILSKFINTDWFTQESAERGQAVHECCQLYLMGGAHILELPDQWKGYFTSFQKWVDVAKPQVELSEKRLICENYKYCGQPDFIGRTVFRDGRGLIDYKTSILFVKWHRLQIAGYRHLSMINGLETKWGAVLRLRSNGAIAKMDYVPDNYLIDFNRFVMALSLYSYFN